MFRLSSTFSQELHDAVPHSHWHQRSDCSDAFSNPDQQPPAAEQQLHNCIYPERSSIIFAKSLAKNSQSLCTFRVVVERPALPFHFSAHHTRRLHVRDALLNHRRKKQESFITPLAPQQSNSLVLSEATERHHQDRCLKLEFVNEKNGVVCLWSQGSMRTPVSESRSPRKTDGFHNQQVIRQIHHSHSQVKVCEAVIKDRLHLFTDSSHDDDNIQIDHSRDLSLVIVNRSSLL